MAKNRIHTLLLVFLIFTSKSVMSQSYNTLSFFKYNPYSNFANPAYHIPYKGYVGFPAIASLNFNLFNSNIRYQNLFSTDADGYPITVTPNVLIENLNENKNWINCDFDTEILGFGFRTKKLFFSFSYRLITEERFRFSKTLLDLPLRGNLNYVGEDNPAVIDLDLAVSMYQEMSIGLNWEVNDKLTLGFRPKILFGLANLNTRQLTATLITDPESYNLSLNYAVDTRLSSVIPIQFVDNAFVVDFDNIQNKMLSSFSNVGAALDLGASYRFNKKFDIGAAYSNLGFIHWKSNDLLINGIPADEGGFYQNGNFFFSGLNENQIIGLVQDSLNYREEFIDSLKSYFPINVTSLNSYNTMLSGRFSLEGNYHIGKSHCFTAVFQGYLSKRNFIPAFTIAYTGSFAKLFFVNANYTVTPNNYLNLGLGVGLKLEALNLYIGTNNILASFMPLQCSNYNVQLGLFFTIGKIQEKPIAEIKVDE